MYFSTSIENHEPKYLTHYEGEEERCIKGSIIMEEEEDAAEDVTGKDYKDFIKVLASKANKTVKNEDSGDDVDEEMAADLKQFDMERLSHI
jgi:hypothetical protein